MDEFRLFRVVQRFVQERWKKGHTRWELHNKADKMVEVRTLCRMSNSGVVQSLLKQTWSLFARELGTCTQTFSVSKELVSQHVENSSDQRKEQFKRQLSHLGQANGKAESTEEATVCVNDLDVSVKMVLLQDSPAVLSLGL